MPKKMKENSDSFGLEETKWNVAAIRAMHLCLALDEFTGSDFAEFAEKEGVPSEFIARYSGAIFRKMAAVHAIRKTKRFRLSVESRPQPIWITARKIRQAMERE
jgi:hypothetical protein